MPTPSKDIRPGIVITRAPGEVRSSIVCVSNNPEVLGTHLLASVATQDEPHDLIVVDSAVFKPKSAAHALNAGAAHARGQWLIFAHQDIAFGSDFVRRFCDAAGQPPDIGIGGVMGVTMGRQHEINLVNQITQGLDGKTFTIGARVVAEPTAVESVDEMCFIIQASLFKSLSLDETACARWDLYAVDYSLAVRERGLRAYVLPVTLRHLSLGALSDNYYATLDRLVQKHRSHVSSICTTCGTWNTTQSVRVQRVRKLGRSILARIRKLAGK